MFHPDGKWAWKRETLGGDKYLEIVSISIVKNLDGR